jgi:hypothetical protein
MPYRFKTTPSSPKTLGFTRANKNMGVSPLILPTALWIKARALAKRSGEAKLDGWRVKTPIAHSDFDRRPGIGSADIQWRVATPTG